MKKYRRIQRRGNLVVFPGTLERLVQEAYTYFERAQFAEAIDYFEQVLALDPFHEEVMGPYAYALYEEKRYPEAKEITEQLLQEDEYDTIEWIELYLTICIQLREYDYVSTEIERLLQEDAVPEHALKKFHYLKELNERLVHKYEEFEQREPEIKLLSFAQFFELSPIEQQNELVRIRDVGKRSFPLLREIVTQSDAPFLQTNALLLLKEHDDSEPLLVKKYDMERQIVPNSLSHPFENDKVQRVISQVEQRLEKTPSLIEFTFAMIQKYSIAAYPFRWETYEVEEVAKAYCQYAQSLFEDGELDEDPLLTHIRQVEVEEIG